MALLSFETAEEKAMGNQAGSRMVLSRNEAFCAWSSPWSLLSSLIMVRGLASDFQALTALRNAVHVTAKEHPTFW